MYFVPFTLSFPPVDPAFLNAASLHLNFPLFNDVVLYSGFSYKSSQLYWNNDHDSSEHLSKILIVVKV